MIIIMSGNKVIKLENEYENEQLQSPTSSKFPLFSLEGLQLNLMHLGSTSVNWSPDVSIISWAHRTPTLRTKDINISRLGTCNVDADGRNNLIYLPWEIVSN